MRTAFAALALLALLPCALCVSESAALASTSLKRGQRAVLYMFVTNRNLECTHPVNFTASANNSLPIDCVKYTQDIWQKAVFIPYVDEMTRLEIPGTYKFYQTASNNWQPSVSTNESRPGVKVYLQITQGGKTYKTLPKQYSAGGSYFVGAWSAYIRMNKGVVSGISWDDGCQECSGSQCVQGDCGIPDAECQKAPAACDMKLYLGWVGSDNAGWQCTSVGDLPTRLRVLSLGQVYKQAAGIPSSDFIL